MFRTMTTLAGQGGFFLLALSFLGLTSLGIVLVIQLTSRPLKK